MKTNLTESEKADLIPHIQSVLDGGDQWESKEMHYPAGAIIAAILGIPGVDKDESDDDKNGGFDQNGWQWDWWQDFTHEGKTYTLGGSGYYGGHTFGLSEDA